MTDILLAIMSGKMDDEGLRSVLKSILREVSGDLIDYYNDQCKEKSIKILKNNLQSFLFEGDWIEKFSKELFKRFEWWSKGVKKGKITLQDLMKGFSKADVGSTFIKILHIPRINTLKALNEQFSKSTPS